MFAILWKVKGLLGLTTYYPCLTRFFFFHFRTPSLPKSQRKMRRQPPQRLLQQRSQRLKKLQRRGRSRESLIQPKLKQQRPPRRQRLERRPRARLLKQTAMLLLLKQLGNEGRRLRSKFIINRCFILFCFAIKS